MINLCLIQWVNIYAMSCVYTQPRRKYTLIWCRFSLPQYLHQKSVNLRPKGKNTPQAYIYTFLVYIALPQYLHQQSVNLRLWCIVTLLA